MSAIFPNNTHENWDQNVEAISDSLIKVLLNYEDKKSKLSPVAYVTTSISSTINELNKFGLFSLAPTKHKTGISRLQEIATRPFGFLEAEDDILFAIESALQDEEHTLSVIDDPLAAKAFAYLKERVNYIRTVQKRMPSALMTDIKVLLVGDGWVKRSQETHPCVQWAKENPQLEDALQLQRRGYLPEQVYTINRTWGQLADYTGYIEDIPPEVLPEDYFDIVYFEGMCFENEEIVQQALTVVLPTLKDNGLVLYNSTRQEDRLIMTAKSGVITQEKLDSIPEPVKKSVARQFDRTPLDTVTIPESNTIMIDRKNSRIL